MAELALQLQDFRLTTAEILYHLPDHPLMLQSFLWQDYDKAPEYPKLQKFLYFWETKIDGKLHSVRVATNKLITASELRATNGEFVLQ